MAVTMQQAHTTAQSDASAEQPPEKKKKARKKEKQSCVCHSLTDKFVIHFSSNLDFILSFFFLLLFSNTII